MSDIAFMIEVVKRFVMDNSVLCLKFEIFFMSLLPSQDSAYILFVFYPTCVMVHLWVSIVFGHITLHLLSMVVQVRKSFIDFLKSPFFQSIHYNGAEALGGGGTNMVWGILKLKPCSLIFGIVKQKFEILRIGLF